MKLHKIIIKSSGRETEEIEHCPFWGCAIIEGTFRTRDFCTRKDIECKYGLTHIQVPKKCPLRKNSITTDVSLKK